MGGADGGGETEVGGVEDGAGVEEWGSCGTVGGLAVDELAGVGFGRSGEGGVGLGEGEFFHGDDGVAVGGEDGAGHDLPAVGGFEFVGDG